MSPAALHTALAQAFAQGAALGLYLGLFIGTALPWAATLRKRRAGPPCLWEDAAQS